MSFIYKILPFVLLLTLVGCNSTFTDWVEDNWSEEDEVCDDDTTSVSFKKVAYWSSDDDTDENLENVDFDGLTHIIYTSISVNADGSFDFTDNSDKVANFEDFLSYAQDQGIEVAVSLGDGYDNNFNTIAESSTITTTFVNNVIDFLDDYGLDGVDLNWQTIGGDDESDNLEELLDELKEDLSEEGYFLTMALPSGEYTSADNIDNNMFVYIDFANVMAFDSTDSDDLHSSMEDAEEAITYWTDRCLIQNKLVLGIPFYSAGDAVRSYDYIVKDDTSYACLDESEGRDYNGIPTVMDKTSYALLYAGGIMIKSLEQDYYDDESYSLLNSINEISDGDDEYDDVCGYYD